MAALGLPLALVLGLLAELAGGLVSRFTGGERRWWRPVTGIWGEARRLARARTGRARPAVVEALGTVAAFTGGGLAAAGALGLLPGSAALVYLSLALGGAGLRLVDPVRVPAGEVAAALRRRRAALAEPAFVVALGALLLRWRAFDLDAIRATQTVLGPGLTVGPPLLALAVALAAVAALAASALRLGRAPEPARREGQTRDAGARLLGTVARWAVAGGTALVLAALVAGHRLDASPEILPFVGAAAASAVLIGAGAAAFWRSSARWQATVAGAALLLAGTAVALAVAA